MAIPGTDAVQEAEGHTMECNIRKRSMGPVGSEALARAHAFCSVVQGWLACHSVPTHFRAITAFRYHVVNLRRRMLKRRSQKVGMTCERIERIAKDRLPTARILHPWAAQRFVEGHPRWEPGACIALAGLCAGGGGSA